MIDSENRRRRRAVLALGAIFVGFTTVEHFVGAEYESFWGKALFMLPTHEALEHAHHVPLWVKLSPLVAGILGISLAYYMYMFRPDLPPKVAAAFPESQRPIA